MKLESQEVMFLVEKLRFFTFDIDLGLAVSQHLTFLYSFSLNILTCYMFLHSFDIT